MKIIGVNFVLINFFNKLFLLRVPKKYYEGKINIRKE